MQERFSFENFSVFDYLLGTYGKPHKQGNNRANKEKCRYVDIFTKRIGCSLSGGEFLYQKRQDYCQQWRFQGINEDVLQIAKFRTYVPGGKYEKLFKSCRDLQPALWFVDHLGNHW